MTFSTRVVQLLKDQIDTFGGFDMGQRVGYKRVSTFEQRTDRQLEGVELDKVFEDKCSGKDLKRPQWAEAERYLREGDVLLVHSMDRLSRSLADLLDTVERLVVKGVEVRFVQENLVFEAGADVKPMGKLLLSLLGAVAEFERSMIRERQREGVALAKQRGAYKGRKPALRDDQAELVRQRVGAGEKVARVARDLKVCRATVYAYLK